MKVSLAAAMRDPNLLGGPFQAESFWPWHAVAKLISGEPLDEREAQLFRECTGRQTLPTAPVNRLIALIGRRGGKDRFMSAVAVHRAALSGSWKSVMSAGEQAAVILLGADKKHSRITRRYCQGLLATPLLAAEVTRTSDEMIEFRSGASLEIVTNDASLVRGRSAIALLGSECCYWNTAEGSASSDEDVVGAAEPSLALCVDGGLLMLASSVSRRSGYMFRRWQELFGNDDAEDLCWLAPSRTMNSALPEKVTEKAYRQDPARASAEFGSIWRESGEDFIPRQAVESCTDFGVHERSPIPGVRYFGFVDAASGTAKDCFGIAIAHRERDGTAVLDFLRERKPRFVPAAVVKEYSEILKIFRVSTIQGDRWASGWNADEWSRAGIRYQASELTKSELYLAVLPRILSGQIRLLDSPTLRDQFAGLVRRVHSTGRESVDDSGSASARDDLANCCAGALVAASAGSAVVLGSAIVMTGPPRNIPGSDVYTGYSGAGRQRSWDRLMSEEPKSGGWP